MKTQLMRGELGMVDEEQEAATGSPRPASCFAPFALGGFVSILGQGMPFVAVRRSQSQRCRDMAVIALRNGSKRAFFPSTGFLAVFSVGTGCRANDSNQNALLSVKGNYGQLRVITAKKENKNSNSNTIISQDVCQNLYSQAL
jgi:hypothetical protein